MLIKAGMDHKNGVKGKSRTRLNSCLQNLFMINIEGEVTLHYSVTPPSSSVSEGQSAIKSLYESSEL